MVYGTLWLLNGRSLQLEIQVNGAQGRQLLCYSQFITKAGAYAIAKMQRYREVTFKI